LARHRTVVMPLAKSGSQPSPYERRAAISIVADLRKLRLDLDDRSRLDLHLGMSGPQRQEPPAPPRAGSADESDD